MRNAAPRWSALRTGGVPFLRSHRRLPCAAVVALTATLAWAPVPSARAVVLGHQVKLHRPTSVGARSRVVIEGEQKTQSTARSAAGVLKQLPLREKRVHFEAIEQVNTIDARGRPVESLFTIVRFAARDASGAMHALLPEGKQLLVSRAPHEKDSRLTVEGVPLEKEPLEALQAVLTLNHDEKNPTDDEAFGDAAPHIAGDSWPIHADVMERSFRDEGDAVSVSGRATLLHAPVVNGVPCLEVEAQIKVVSGDEPAALVTTGERPAHQEMQMTARSVYPNDPSKQEIAWTDSVTVQTTFRVPARVGTPRSSHWRRRPSLPSSRSCGPNDRTHGREGALAEWSSTKIPRLG